MVDFVMGDILKRTNNIPVGFQVHITTWENDGDAYTTQIFSGLSNEDVHFYVDFVKFFSGTDGNDFIEYTRLREFLTELQMQHPHINSDLKSHLAEALIEDARYELDDFIHEILHSPVEEGYYDGGHRTLFCRACDSIQIFHIPSEIKDVTTDFV